MHCFRDLPVSEKPRERLILKGAQVLTDAELLAIVLRVGCKQRNVLELSMAILKQFSLSRVFNLSYEELICIKGMGKAKACQMLALAEIIKRVNTAPMPLGKRITTPDDAAFVCNDIRHMEEEHLVALYLNARHRLIKRALLSVGNLDSSIVDPREVFKHAFKCNAKAVILVHNHPSGEHKPSDEDIAITRLIKDAAEFLNIKLIDHIVLSSTGFSSMSKEGYL
ncbi:hypothetical protein DRJ48_00560 [Candidatus Woesearchaeota archaeon]|nr:MAG: hypothetical protein DRJ48_00560 [Candidatus Woesearchaeota archaeon]